MVVRKTRPHPQWHVRIRCCTDGTLEAAAWESGIDNAIRFDGAVMLKNEGYEDAWSMDQESVDLNAYLALECKLLKKFSSLLKIPSTHRTTVAR